MVIVRVLIGKLPKSIYDRAQRPNSAVWPLTFQHLFDSWPQMTLTPARSQQSRRMVLWSVRDTIHVNLLAAYTFSVVISRGNLILRKGSTIWTATWFVTSSLTPGQQHWFSFDKLSKAIERLVNLSNRPSSFGDKRGGGAKNSTLNNLRYGNIPARRRLSFNTTDSVVSGTQKSGSACASVDTPSLACWTLVVSASRTTHQIWT